MSFEWSPVPCISRARVFMHLAVTVPALAPLVGPRGLAGPGLWLMAACGLVASQMGACAGWWVIEQGPPSCWRKSIMAGLVTTLGAFVSFGVVFALMVLVAAPLGGFGNVGKEAFSALSVMAFLLLFGTWYVAPFAIAVAVIAVHWHGREQAALGIPS